MSGSDTATVIIRSVRVDAPDGGKDRPCILKIDELLLFPGELTVIAGPSGSGKSTLLNALSGITPIGSGAIDVCSEAVSTFHEARRDDWRRRSIGMIFQDFNLIADLSPLDNIRLPATFGRLERPVSADAIALMDRFAIPRARASVSLMSRGEQQRVAIARALLFDPPVILADEPTASLDAANGAFVIDTLLAEAAKGKTVIVVSHDPELAARAGRTVRLDHGRIVSGSTP